MIALSLIASILAVHSWQETLEAQRCTFVKPTPYANGVYRVTRTAKPITEQSSCVASTGPNTDEWECCHTGDDYPSCGFAQRTLGHHLSPWYEDTSTKTRVHTTCFHVPAENGCLWILRAGYRGYEAVKVESNAPTEVQGGLSYYWLADCDATDSDTFDPKDFTHACSAEPSSQGRGHNPPAFEQIPSYAGFLGGSFEDRYTKGLYCFQK